MKQSLGDPYHWVDLERPGKLGGVRDLSRGPVPDALDIEDAAWIVLLRVRDGHLVVLALVHVQLVVAHDADGELPARGLARPDEPPDVLEDALLGHEALEDLDLLLVAVEEVLVRADLAPVPTRL